MIRGINTTSEYRHVLGRNAKDKVTPTKQEQYNCIRLEIQKLFAKLNIKPPSLKVIKTILRYNTLEQSISLKDVIKIKRKLKNLVISPLDRHLGELSIE